MNLEQEASKGDRFAELKEPFDEILNGMRASITAQMDKVPLTQVDMHSKLILTHQLLNGIERHIKTVIDTGKMASFQIKQLQEAEERKKFFGIL